MSEWIMLNKGWLLRPVIQGLELISHEYNITLECSTLQDQDKLARILRGHQYIPQTAEGKVIREVLRGFESQGILQVLDHRPPMRPFTETEETLWRLRRHVVGSRGPISIVYWLNPKKSTFSPNFELFSAKYVMFREQGEEEMRGWASGAQKNLEIAELKAIMEALERYASGVIPSEELIRSSAKKIGDVAIDPRRVVNYSETQYKSGLPLFPFTNDREYYWKEVVAYPSGETRYLPVDCLYYPVESKFTPYPFTFANSSGVAAGLEFEKTLIRALYEAIERDAFMITWLNHLVRPRIEKQSLPKSQRYQVERIEEIGYRVYLINLTLDLAPVILIAAVSYRQKPALVLGMASNLNPIEAITAGLIEVERQLYWDLRKDTTIFELSDPKEVNEVTDHMALYTSQEHLSKASFLWQGKPRPLTKEDDYVYNELSQLLNMLECQGREVVVADLTPVSLRSLGVWVIRAIPLGLVPISFGYGMEPLGMERIKNVPKKLGITPRHPWEHEPFTHPFA